MAVGIAEAVGRAVAEVAVEPVPLDAAGLERGDPARERLRAVGAVGEVADARLRATRSA